MPMKPGVVTLAWHGQDTIGSYFSFSEWLNGIVWPSPTILDSILEVLQSTSNYLIMAAATFLTSWIKTQKPQGLKLKDAPTFYRNLEEALDVRRASHSMFTRVQNSWRNGSAIDFCSNDLLSLGSSGHLRIAFLAELAKYPDFALYAGGSRVMDGNYDYIEEVEQEIAEFHGAESALMVNSGFDGNVAIYTAIPRPGDAIVYDELSHASTHDGMAHSLALIKVPFRHNDIDSFRDALWSVMNTQPMIKDGSRSILVSVESVYSMDGDICPLLELLEIAREICSKGNFAFIVDEAHATGIIGPRGAGLISALGVEKDIAVRLHTCGKALASSGGELINFPDQTTFSSGVTDVLS